METQEAKASTFLELHRPSSPLLLPNPWDEGSARLFEWLGFSALATTSSGTAATMGLFDGSLDRGRVLVRVAAIVGVTGLPVSADLENGFGDDPATVAETVRLALDTGLAGCSIEDYSRNPDDPIYERGLAGERIRAAAEVAHAGPVHLVLTGRCENHLHGRDDLADTIERLQAYQDAGADVLYAPGLTSLGDITRVVAAVDRPVNVLARPGGPTVPELAGAGVSRVSVGGALCFAALGTVVDAARQLMDTGTYTFADQAAVGTVAARAAFATPPDGGRVSS